MSGITPSVAMIAIRARADNFPKPRNPDFAGSIDDLQSFVGVDEIRCVVFDPPLALFVTDAADVELDPGLDLVDIAVPQFDVEIGDIDFERLAFG